MENYYAGIVGSVQAVNTFETRPWWCVPFDAKKGDQLLLYCPRSISKKNQGLFALCTIKNELDKFHVNNHYCSGFGRIFGRISKKLLYCDLVFVKRYNITLTAKEMKRDHLLSRSNIVRRNFQGTTFKLEKAIFERMISLLKSKN